MENKKELIHIISGKKNPTSRRENEKDFEEKLEDLQLFFDSYNFSHDTSVINSLNNSLNSSFSII